MFIRIGKPEIDTDCEDRIVGIEIESFKDEKEGMENHIELDITLDDIYDVEDIRFLNKIFHKAYENKLGVLMYNSTLNKINIAHDNYNNRLTEDNIYTETIENVDRYRKGEVDKISTVESIYLLLKWLQVTMNYLISSDENVEIILQIEE